LQQAVAAHPAAKQWTFYHPFDGFEQARPKRLAFEGVKWGLPATPRCKYWHS
jgi:hypothetical protein